MFGRFRHCRTYALVTLLVINLFPITALAISETRTVTVTGRVCLPETASATITSPTTGEVFHEAVITVRGTTNEISVPIEVERNGASAGTTLAEPDGTWSMPVTLTPGANSLVAISCQTSPAVHVTYQPPQPTPSPPSPASPPPSAGPGGSQSGLGTPGHGGDQEPQAPVSPGETNQDKSGGRPPKSVEAFFLTTTRGLITGAAERNVELDVIIQNGEPPYQATLAWGDGSSDQRKISQQSKQTFTHRFTAGDFKPLLQMTDARGRPASLAYVARISPAAKVPGIIKLPRNPDTLLQLLLIEAALTLVVFSGWEAIHQRHLLASAGCPGGKE